MRCKECLSTQLITNRKSGTIVCESCGLVQSNSLIDEGAEWRNFGSDGNDGGKTDMNRVGGTLNPYLSSGGLDTYVKGQGADLF